MVDLRRDFEGEEEDDGEAEEGGVKEGLTIGEAFHERMADVVGDVDREGLGGVDEEDDSLDERRSVVLLLL